MALGQNRYRCYRVVILNPMTGDLPSLIHKQAPYSGISLHQLKNFFIVGEAKFLLACLAKEFNPSFIIASLSNLEIALAFKSIKRSRDFLGAATTSTHASVWVTSPVFDKLRVKLCTWSHPRPLQMHPIFVMHTTPM